MQLFNITYFYNIFVFKLQNYLIFVNNIAVTHFNANLLMKMKAFSKNCTKNDYKCLICAIKVMFKVNFRKAKAI